MRKISQAIQPRQGKREATIIATLKADSGYQSTETHRISANQWGRIVAIMKEAAE